MKKLALLFLVMLLCSIDVIAQEQVDQKKENEFRERVAWFQEARLGMFIHWSVGAVEGARWKGEKLRNPLPYGEWLRCRNRVPREGYDKLISQMSITPELVDKWVRLAKESGMKYVMFVAKHHDGLAFWPSKVSDYTYPNLTGTGTDVLQLLRESCDRHQMKLGFYYSQWQDWEHPYGWGNFWDFEDDPSKFNNVSWERDLNNGALFRPTLTQKQFNQYWEEKSVPQIKELILNYDPDIFWFDMYRPREETIVTQKQAEDLLATIRELSPKCLVNTRFGIAEVGPKGVDYQTMADNQFPEYVIDHPWESSATLNKSWGYNRDDDAWRSTSYFIKSVVANISRGGNIQINIGPKADGTVPREMELRLNEIGNCIAQNGAGFYGTGTSPFEANTQDWGLVTTKNENGKSLLYLHVFEWPIDGVIRLNGLKNNIKSARITATNQALKVNQKGVITRIQGPKYEPVNYDTVIEVELEGTPEVDNSFIGEKNNKGYFLNPERATVSGNPKILKGDNFWIPQRIATWKSKSDTASWKIYIPEAGERLVEICYASSIETAGQSYSVNVKGAGELKASVTSTHPQWKEYRAFKLGTLNFPAPGYYTVQITPNKKINKELFHLAWLHVE